VLEELDEDLGRQEVVIRERRAWLAPLLAEVRAGRFAAEGPVSPEFARLLVGLGEVPDSPIAVQDREHLAFLDALVPEEERGSLMTTLYGMREHAGEVYGPLDALADEEPDDLQVGPCRGSAGGPTARPHGHGHGHGQEWRRGGRHTRHRRQEAEPGGHEV
jgi:hypothetical protein